MVSSRRQFLAALFALIVAIGASTPASAHDTSTVDGHIAEDSVTLTPEKEQRLERETRQAARSDAVDAGGRDADPGVVGEWGPVAPWPAVAVHAALLENGKVLAYDNVGDGAAESYPNDQQIRTRATVWDPATGSQTVADAVTGVNLFCSGLAHLADGNIFVAGGNKDNTLAGSPATHIFDEETNGWTRGPDMAVGRWYPTVTPMSNGEMLITEGDYANPADNTPPNAGIPEVRQTDGSLRSLPGAKDPNLPLYPWIDLAPDGRAFMSGPDTTMQRLDTTGNGSWAQYGQRDSIYRGYGSHALYDVGKILIAGGSRKPADMDEALTIDINPENPVVQATEPLETGRRQHNLTVLADGTVLATGGITFDPVAAAGDPNHLAGDLVDLDNPAYSTELWDPATGQWSTLAAETQIRQYHSSALLLPDGRLLSAGGGVCGQCTLTGYSAKDAQVFTPPYLFKQDGSGDLAPRPEVTWAPEGVGYDSSFSFCTPDAGSIDKVALMRLGSVTHSVNMEQRYIPLSYAAGGGLISARSPLNANIAPPGVYMLFAVDDDGVPSVAKMVRVATGTGETPPCTQASDPPADPPVISEPPPDTQPPNTRLKTKKSRRTELRKLSFKFSSSEPGSRFECKLDKGSYKRCKSPRKVAVGRGRHEFSVRAIDSAGNVDPTPAKRKF